MTNETAGHKRKNTDAEAPGPKQVQTQDQRPQHHVYKVTFSESDGKRKSRSEGSDPDAMDIDTELSGPRLQFSSDLRLPNAEEHYSDDWNYPVCNSTIWQVWPKKRTG